MRIQQWIKNLFLFAPLIFSGHLFYPDDFIRTIAGFILFSLVSGGVYLFNDITDFEKDKLHPVKSRRPLPSGALDIRTAYVFALCFSGVGIGAGMFLSRPFGFVLGGYLLLNTLYSLFLKHVVILDVMSIAGGFVLRVVAGAVIIAVPTSEWLVICTVLLSLFLGFSKRRNELTFLDKRADTHRAVLSDYSPYFLDQMMSIVTASTVMSYALYTISPDTVAKFGTTHLIYTVPFVLYGIFRYLYLVHKREEGGNPSKLVLTDKPLLINIILWIVTACTIIYSR